MSSALISAAALHDIIGRSEVRIIDASWHMPATKRDARIEYASAHIPGAVFFDLDEVSDKASPYPHMLPSPQQFAQAMGVLGIGNESHVVVYDNVGLFSAPRLWWMFRVFGHDKVQVLDGGLPAWKRQGYRTEQGEATLRTAMFDASYHEALVASREQMRAWSDNGPVQLCDARAEGRFRGEEPEPRPGLKSGHIPRAHNVNHASLHRDGMLKPKVELCALFEGSGIVLAQPIATTCGSGISACILALALYELGYPNVPVYDGSWAEWGSLNLPVAIGA